MIIFGLLTRSSTLHVCTKKSTLKVVGVLVERMVDEAGLSVLVCMQGAALEVVWGDLPRKRQEVTRSVKKRQEASSRSISI